MFMGNRRYEGKGIMNECVWQLTNHITCNGYGWIWMDMDGYIDMDGHGAAWVKQGKVVGMDTGRMGAIPTYLHTLPTSYIPCYIVYIGSLAHLHSY